MKKQYISRLLALPDPGFYLEARHINPCARAQICIAKVGRLRTFLRTGFQRLIPATA